MQLWLMSYQCDITFPRDYGSLLAGAFAGTQSATFTSTGTGAVKAAKPVQFEAAPSLFRFNQPAPSQSSPRQASWQTRAATVSATESAAEGPSIRFTFAGSQSGTRVAPVQPAGGQAGLSSKTTAQPGTQRAPEAAVVGKQSAGRSAQDETAAGPARPRVSIPAAPGISSGGKGLIDADRTPSIWANDAPSSSIPRGTTRRPADMGPLSNELQGNRDAPFSAAVQEPSAGADANGSGPESPGFVFGQGSTGALA